jgi:hypothetical protein
MTVCTGPVKELAASSLPESTMSGPAVISPEIKAPFIEHGVFIFCPSLVGESELSFIPISSPVSHTAGVKFIILKKEHS